ncbi:hypothetical protein [uncultured Algibacter sp.]|uniref:hypothetical protein n=1 Tax=uncultured Algibacter sp. TaxID=298659 RepID=UPI00261C07B6|nr:hypothetical protein [uncultured Algibacter sp.]
MRSLIIILHLGLLLSTNSNVFAQDIAMTSNSKNPFYDYTEKTLTNVGTIPDFDSKEEKLKITGTIYLSDGITPAKDVILYIEQPNEKGSYEMVKKDSKRYVHHRTWIKTNENGQYTFYTFVPGKRLSSRKLKHIHPVVKQPNMEEYSLPAYLFDDDPKLSKICRKRLAKGGIDSILTLEKKDNILVAKKDIILSQKETTL